MIAPAAKHVAIVGGGFSGTMAAVNLARLAEFPLRVSLINHGYPTGRGIAYSTRRPEHLLNVAARNMSALPEHPEHHVDERELRVVERVDIALVMHTVALRALDHVAEPARRSNIPVIK